MFKMTIFGRNFCQKSYEIEKNDIKVGRIIENDQALYELAAREEKRRNFLKKVLTNGERGGIIFG